MGGGSPATSSQTITNRTELPPWLEDITKENLARADALSNRPYQAYPGQLTAGFSPEQEAAFQFAQAGVGATQPMYNQAYGVTSGVANYTPQQVQAQNFLQGDVSGYMNPYVQNVEQAALSRLEGATKQAVNRIGDQAAAARAFGGSRQGIAEGVALGEAARSAGELSANLRSQAFQQAAQQMQADQNRALQASLANQQAGLSGAGLNLQGGAGLANIAGQYQQARGLDAATLENVGRARQAMAQQQLDEAYARFMEEKNYPVENLNLRLAATSATPYGTTQTQTRPYTAPNSFLTGLGTLGSAASGIASLFSLFSDERAKTDIQKVGKDPESGLDMYAYRYKGDPKSYPKVVGPMAQDIEKKYPEAVREIGGKKTVNLGFGPMRKAFKNG